MLYYAEYLHFTPRWTDKQCIFFTVIGRADDEDISPELKVEREKLRRQQNNARER